MANQFLISNRAKHIFLIEDDESMRATLKGLLEFAGYQVHDYSSPLEFLGVAQAFKTFTVVTGEQERAGTPPIFSEIMQARYLGTVTISGDVTTLGNQEYTANQIDIGTSQSTSAYTFTASEGRVIFNTGATGSNVAPTAVGGNTYRVIDTESIRLAKLSSNDITAALVLSEIHRTSKVNSDIIEESRKVSKGGTGLEIVCLDYDGDGNCRLDD
ncbi:hypothetical protein ICV01_07270 [Polynucleobacter sp. MWH-Spelu-300-X4]|uniref:hypothetical protein n=1 Tax=Polynucleobacter sp. MWH-Spelu-300-X4 TaxID=2689109 RepID=UPI001BFEC96D|nr:hypothetical protein [Polynucleobacter sp. MWH-Spelu-300-X4]QWD79436.1 hypothetical protein ICV01_07270 [Polynucleobacter sp. MWH-Spelu-300-X4]